MNIIILTFVIILALQIFAGSSDYRARHAQSVRKYMAKKAEDNQNRHYAEQLFTSSRKPPSIPLQRQNSYVIIENPKGGESYGKTKKK